MTDVKKGGLVRHEQYGVGRVATVFGVGESAKCAVYFARTDQRLVVPQHELSLVGPADAAGYDLVKLAVREIQQDDVPDTELAERWRGGELVLKPANPQRESKVIPLDTFFHKIVMLRDRLRVMEQQINAHKGLSEVEKVQLQQYITRIYGSLTTFNLLFQDKNDQFVGQKGDD